MGVSEKREGVKKRKLMDNLLAHNLPRKTSTTAPLYWSKLVAVGKSNGNKHSEHGVARRESARELV